MYKATLALPALRARWFRRNVIRDIQPGVNPTPRFSIIDPRRTRERVKGEVAEFGGEEEEEEGDERDRGGEEERREGTLA